MAPTSPSSSRPHRRGISFSGKSDRSSNSGPKVSLTESAEEKYRRSLHTKADPTLAMNEAQPGTLSPLHCAVTNEAGYVANG
jgi:hypothetical protein